MERGFPSPAYTVVREGNSTASGDRLEFGIAQLGILIPSHDLRAEGIGIEGIAEGFGLTDKALDQGTFGFELSDACSQSRVLLKVLGKGVELAHRRKG